MYGFKGTDKNMKCRGFQYTLNKEYKHEGEIELWKAGFHFCKKLNDVFDYYSLRNGSRYFIVKYGENHLDDKCYDQVSDTITLLEEITPEFILSEDCMNNYEFLHNYIDDLLLLFSSRGDLKVVKYLVSIGAKISCGHGHAVVYATRNNQLEVVKYLSSLGNMTHNNVALVEASEYGFLEIVKFLHSIGADIRFGYDEAIRYAYSNGHLEVVNYLLSQGVDIEDNLALKSSDLCGDKELVEYINQYKSMESKSKELFIYEVFRPRDPTKRYLNNPLDDSQHTRFIICCNNETEARNTHPRGKYQLDLKKLKWYYIDDRKRKIDEDHPEFNPYHHGWVYGKDVKNLIVRKLGNAANDINKAIIMNEVYTGEKPDWKK